MSIQQFKVLIILLIIQCGCATGIIINNINSPLVKTKKIVAASIPGGIRKTSINQREFFSQYFDREEMIINSKEVKERFYAQVLILGDRRPYKIEVRVYQEKRKTRHSETFVIVGQAKSLAKKIAVRILDRLVQSREKHSALDDVRPI